jgi:hypothetical protein
MKLAGRTEFTEMEMPSPIQGVHDEDSLRHGVTFVAPILPVVRQLDDARIGQQLDFASRDLDIVGHDVAHSSVPARIVVVHEDLSGLDLDRLDDVGALPHIADLGLRFPPKDHEGLLSARSARGRTRRVLLGTATMPQFWSWETGRRLFRRLIPKLYYGNEKGPVRGLFHLAFQGNLIVYQRRCFLIYEQDWLGRSPKRAAYFIGDSQNILRHGHAVLPNETGRQHGLGKSLPIVPTLFQLIRVDYRLQNNTHHLRAKHHNSLPFFVKTCRAQQTTVWVRAIVHVLDVIIFFTFLAVSVLVVEMVTTQQVAIGA